MPRPKGAFSKIMHKIFSNLGIEKVREKKEEMPETSREAHLKPLQRNMRRKE